MMDRVLLTCEPGGAEVPAKYRGLFRTRAAQSALRSHRGSDHGALWLAKSLQRSLRAPLLASTVTRLLVDLNRSLGHPQLFSEFSRPLDPTARVTLLESLYYPHRDRVESWIREQSGHGDRTLHIGVHSFTPALGGEMRAADVGLLYDPSRSAEQSFCRAWKQAIHGVDSELRVRRNYPFLGKADGLVTHLRAVFGPRAYVGIEVEVNQALLRTADGRRRTARATSRSLRLLLGRE